MKASFLKLAQREFDDAASYYESEQIGLGARFRSEVFRALNRVVAFPSSYQSFGIRTRRCLIAKFPYSIVYRFDSDTSEVLVVAIAHLHRGPDYWVGRESQT